jgi:hypothetical protein
MSTTVSSVHPDYAHVLTVRGALEIARATAGIDQHRYLAILAGQPDACAGPALAGQRHSATRGDRDRGNQRSTLRRSLRSVGQPGRLIATGSGRTD